MSNYMERDRFVTASVVLYRTNPNDLKKVIDSFLFSDYNFRLYLIDNSPSDELKSFERVSIEYIHNPSNPGFGAGHNIAITKAIINYK